MAAEQIGLPYKEFLKTDLAGRTEVREHDDITMSRQTYKVAYKAIRVRPGFNARKVYTGIEELADLIDANGLITPLNVDVLKDGKIFVERGHRRLKALDLLAARYRDTKRGKEFEERFGYIECFVNGTATTELERIKNLYTSNHICPLSPVENGDVILRLKIFFKFTHEQIAKELGISRQSVDNYAKLAGLPDDVKQAIASDKISVNNALSVVRKIKDADQQSEAFQELLSGKTTNLNNKGTGKLPTSMQPIKKDEDLEDEDDNDEETDNETPAPKIKDPVEVKGLTTDSEQVAMLNNVIQMMDKLDGHFKHLEKIGDNAINSSVKDMSILTDASRRKVEEVRDFLKKQR